MSDYDQQPIIPDLPQTLGRLGRKYSGQAPDPNNVLYPALSAASPAARSALQRIDLQRVARGSEARQVPHAALLVERRDGLRAGTLAHCRMHQRDLRRESARVFPGSSERQLYE